VAKLKNLKQFVVLVMVRGMSRKMAGLRFDDRELVITRGLCSVAHIDADDYKFLKDPESVAAELGRARLGIDLFTFLPKLPDTTPKYPYPFEWDNMAVLSVSTFEQWWTKQIGFKARNKAKPAEKWGVVVREVPFDDALARGICEIYNESPVRQGRRFPHYGKSLETVTKMSGTYLSSSVFIGAFDGETLIGFIKLTIDDTRNQAGIMHIISALQARDKAPTNALIVQAVRSCADRGIPNLVYSKFSYGKKLTSSLSDFKERNGFQRVDLPRYYVPLTRWGSAAFAMKLHRKLVDRVPESVAAKLRDLRTTWYQRKFQLKAEAL
jgi:hypothetical protein